MAKRHTWESPSCARRFALVVACIGTLAGCEPKENPILSNERFPGDVYPPNMLLNKAQEAQVITALQATAAGMPTSPLTDATDAVRWGDVRQAAGVAATLAEMGMLSSKLEGSTWTFRIETLSGAPVTLSVEERPPPLMYLATAKAGSFGEEFDKAERLVREFRMAMRRLGKIKRPS
ncbi:MAG: hypothetical protein EXS03_03445 [Phycisphaerales bacterium]|nr:hypothetical protein [Phycisphaerales bacterium]